MAADEDERRALAGAIAVFLGEEGAEAVDRNDRRRPDLLRGGGVEPVAVEALQRQESDAGAEDGPVEGLETSEDGVEDDGERHGWPRRRRRSSGELPGGVCGEEDGGRTAESGYLRDGLCGLAFGSWVDGLNGPDHKRWMMVGYNDTSCLI